MSKMKTKVAYQDKQYTVTVTVGKYSTECTDNNKQDAIQCAEACMFQLLKTKKENQND